MLGIALKSLTGSRKFVEIMNRLGHCISYHTIEEIETEATFESTKNNFFTSSGMKLDPECGTGVAWDNFDRFVETVSGEDTLHGAVGIAYQTVIIDDSNETKHNNTKTSNLANAPNQQSKHTANKKWRRAYETAGLNIQPYRKKTKIKTAEFLSNDDPRRKQYEEKSVSKNKSKLDML